MSDIKLLFIEEYKGQSFQTYLFDQISGGVHNMPFEMTQFLAYLIETYTDTKKILDWEAEFAKYTNRKISEYQSYCDSMDAAYNKINK